MFKLSEKANPNYTARIVELTNIRKHSNADRLQVSTIDGNDVITGTNAKVGDVVVYFPLECVINKDFLSATNSFENKELNEDKTVKGFFNDKGRVRAVKLRGQPSMGYIVPVDVFFTWLASVFASSTIIYSNKYLNAEFDSVLVGNKDILICKKYVNLQEKYDAQKEKRLKDTKYKAKKQSKLVENQFRLHCDTEQLGRNIHRLYPQDIIAITHKLHGTSGVFSKILCNKKLNWYQKALKFMGADINETVYDYVYSSRKVIKNQYYNDKEVASGFYGEDIWGTVAKELQPFLEDGLTIYAEIVGFLESGKSIQKDYDYGCDKTQHEVYIYRITSTNTSGKVYEWGTLQIQEWCKNKGLKAVPLYYYGTAEKLFPFLTLDDHWKENFLNVLQQTYLEKDDPICKNKVPDEGICLRREGLNIDTYKLKSFRFLQKASDLFDNNYVDLEDTQC